MAYYLVMSSLSGATAGVIARIKGSSFFIWFLIGFVLPVFGVIAAAVSRFERDELRRRCERCQSVVPLTTQVCTTCGADLEFPETAIAPKSWQPPAGAISKDAR